MVLHSPILSGLRVMYPVKRTYWFDIYKNIDKIPSVNCPVLVIHGTSDEVVDCSYGKQLWDLCKEKFEPLWLEGGNHCDLELCPEYLKHLKKFISTVDKSPYQRYTSMRRTDRFEPARWRTDCFEVSRRSTDWRENPGPSIDKPETLKSNELTSNNIDGLKKLRISIDQMEKSRRSLDYHNKPHKNSEQLERGWKSVNRVDRIWAVLSKHSRHRFVLFRCATITHVLPTIILSKAP
ncbi:hypothetical protein AAC387_Pa12g1027 [Persea americana]